MPGTADYLEKLPKLYEQYHEAGVPGYPDGQHLLEETPSFSDDFVKSRLKDDFHSVYRFMASHHEGRNPYLDGIRRNNRNAQSRHVAARVRSKLLRARLGDDVARQSHSPTTRAIPRC